jgi:hypothetical protein
VTKPEAGVVIVSLFCTILLWIRPAATLPIAGAAGVAIVGYCGYSALKYRERGWRSGVLFVVIVLTLPLWMGALLRLCLG